MHDTLGMLFVAFMTGTLLPDINEHVRIVHNCVESSGSVSVAAARTVADGIKDQKLVLVARSRRQMTKLGNPLKPEAATTAPVVRLHSDRPASYG
jgi:hypothetical protein